MIEEATAAGIVAATEVGVAATVIAAAAHEGPGGKEAGKAAGTASGLPGPRASKRD